jgi:hypothetical protein
MELSQAEGIVDVYLLIKRRLEELGLEQKDLASAAEVTESCVSQLLARKKLPVLRKNSMDDIDPSFECSAFAVCILGVSLVGTPA